MSSTVFESCNSTWVFDQEHMRFRRILKGIEVDQRAVLTEWRPYFGLEVADDTEAFTVLLTPLTAPPPAETSMTGFCNVTEAVVPF